MRVWPVGLLPLAALSLCSTATTLATVPAVPIATRLATSTVLFFSTTASFGTATKVNPTVKQRHFRLGKPAAALNRNPYFSTSTSTSTMSNSNSNSNLNAGPNGLPVQKDDFEGFASQPHIEPTAETAQLIHDAMELFCARPSAAIFARSWSANAIFADPICHAQSSRQYLAQWYGMPAAFSHSQTLAWKLTLQQANQVHYVQKQRYKFKLLGSTKDIIVSPPPPSLFVWNNFLTLEQGGW